MPPVQIILAIFAVTYLGIAVGHIPGLKLNRVGIALLGAIGMVIFGGVSTADAISYINWPTICLLFGFFVISAQLRLSGFYDKVAGSLANQLENPARFLLLLMLVTGGLSAFLNHDIVCYAFAPITGIALLRKQINPVPFLIALTISSNIGAAATLDRQSAEHDDRTGGASGFWPLSAVEHCAGRFCHDRRLRHHLADVAKKSSSGGRPPKMDWRSKLIRSTVRIPSKASSFSSWSSGCFSPRFPRK